MEPYLSTALQNQNKGYLLKIQEIDHYQTTYNYSNNDPNSQYFKMCTIVLIPAYWQ